MIVLGERLDLEVMAEAFTAFNHLSGIASLSTFGPAAYPTNPPPTSGQMTATGELRPVQLALRLPFDETGTALTLCD